jgi:hypothetical protein
VRLLGVYKTRLEDWTKNTSGRFSVRPRYFKTIGLDAKVAALSKSLEVNRPDIRDRLGELDRALKSLNIRHPHCKQHAKAIVSLSNAVINIMNYQFEVPDVSTSSSAAICYSRVLSG